MYSDQFAPGFAGLVFIVPILFACLVALFIFRRLLLNAAVKLYFVLKGESRSFRSEAQSIIERERAAHNEKE